MSNLEKLGADAKFDDTDKLRAALAACPHKGPWLHRAKSNGLFTPPPEGTQYSFGQYLTTLGDDEAADCEIIDYIIAASPDRIARLLDRLEAAERDAARWQFAKRRAYKDGAILALEIGDLDATAAGDFSEFADAAIDAAMQSEKQA